MDWLEAAEAHAVDAEKRRQLRRVRTLLDELTAEQGVLERRAAREAGDAERLERWSFDWLSAVATGSLEERTDKERSESLQAGFEALAHAQMIAAAEDREEELEASLDPLTRHRVEAVLLRLRRDGQSTLADRVPTLIRGLIAREGARCVLQAVEQAGDARGEVGKAESAPDRGRWAGVVALAGSIADLETTQAVDREGALERVSQAESRVVETLAALRELEQAPPQPVEPTQVGAVAAVRRLHELRCAVWDQRAEVGASQARLEAAQRKEKQEGRDVRDLTQASLSRWASLLGGRFDQDLEREIAEHDQALRLAIQAQREHDQREDALAAMQLQLGALGDPERGLELLWSGEGSDGVARLLNRSRHFEEMLDLAAPLAQLQALIRPMARTPFGLFNLLPTVEKRLTTLHRQATAFNQVLFENPGLEVAAFPMEDLEDALDAVRTMINVSKQRHNKHVRRRQMAGPRAALLGHRSTLERTAKALRKGIEEQLNQQEKQRAATRREVGALLQELEAILPL